MRLTMSNLREGGIHVESGKIEGSTGKRMIIQWSDELRAAVGMAKAARPVQLSPYLLCNMRGECYFKENGRVSGWETL